MNEFTLLFPKEYPMQMLHENNNSGKLRLGNTGLN